MKTPIEVRCIACPLAFCCANCRRAHESHVHGISYDCPICRFGIFRCTIDNLSDGPLLQHLATEHLPLRCNKCKTIFNKMDDFQNIDKCATVSDLIDFTEIEDEVTSNKKNEIKEIDLQFNSLYERVSAEYDSVEYPFNDDNFEAILSINKSAKTAVITPVPRKQCLVQYESTSESSDSESEYVAKKRSVGIQTPYAKSGTKISVAKRTATPYVKKVRTKWKVTNSTTEDNNLNDSPSSTTPDDSQRPRQSDNIQISGVENLYEDDQTTTPLRPKSPETLEEARTPTFFPKKEDKCAKLSSAAVTSTPTHPTAPQWSMFPEQGADSPLSEIEGTAADGSPIQSIGYETSKGESSNTARKLKSIITTASRTRGGQESSEKQVTFADTNTSECSSSSKNKRVTFAEDTKFEHPLKPIARVFRKPKRLLTPGPQTKKFCHNPRFQALLNRFENHGLTMARTPVNNRLEDPNSFTPAAFSGVSILPARAINFKDDSPTIESVTEIKNSGAVQQENIIAVKDSPANELFKSCYVDSPNIPSPKKALNTAICAFTDNIAGSLQTCLSAALQSTDDATEIQFKCVITRKRVTVKQIVNDGTAGTGVKSSEFDRALAEKNNEENIWSTITKTVRSVIWGDKNENDCTNSRTPVAGSRESLSSTQSSTGSKRKCEDLSDTDISPVNHKRYKYEGRIRGRRPLDRMLRHNAVSALKISHSAEQQSILRQTAQANSRDDNLNQSF